MPQDTRLARLLHVLIHMHLRGGSTTSDTIAAMLKTNPVVVRRTMAGLRDAGYVVSTGGRGGGWTLTANFAQLTVADVHRATRGGQVFAFGPATDNPQCPVEAAANRFLEASMVAAEAALVGHLSSKTLIEIAREIA
ncbi:MAG: Rrf2 family transcriptional regulator [Comamonas sp.]|nr:Rrf2 family transcriptional regulator [Comamonas sp.]